MASETLSSIIGGGGSFVAETITGTIVISAGVTGLLATITPPSGKRVKLSGLSAITSVDQAGISVAVGGVDIITEQILNGISASSPVDSAGEFKINHGDNNHTFVLGGIDKAVTISKNAGNTAVAIIYAYEFGA